MTMKNSWTYNFWLQALIKHGIHLGLDQPLGGFSNNEIVSTLNSPPFSIVPLNSFYLMLEDISRRSGDSELGFHLAQKIDHTTCDALFFLGHTAPNFGEGLKQCLNIFPEPGERFELHIEGDLAAIRFYPWGSPRRAHSLSATLFVSNMILNVFPFAYTEFTTIEVSLITQDLALCSALSDELGILVEGNALVDEIRFSVEPLSHPNQFANQEMNNFFLHHLRAYQPLNEKNLAEKVSRIIDNRLPGGPLEAASIAQVCGCSVRTLQRRLHQEGWTYRALVEERRLLKARTAINSGHSITEAAFYAGYSEASTLHRKLRRIENDKKKR
jgi:AraC-like DNA-binding protein